ncbi:MAG: PQQ-dependent sugar dehydrogenase [Woeseiaceae bacterium]
MIDDADDEADETVEMHITSVSTGSIGMASATGTIIDDDDQPASGLDSRPVNATCIAPDRPIVNTSIATEVAFPNLPALNEAVGLVQAPGDDSQWYVLEKDGRVLRFDNVPDVAQVSTFIDIRSPDDPIDVDSAGNEAGLLGIAFHPGYGNDNWYVFLSYMVDGAGTGGPYVSVIARFESKDNGLTLDASDATELLRLVQPFGNHNGGQIAFGPDGYLYIGFGDGGSAGDPGDRAQDTSNLFGAMLRIDVDGGTPYAIPADNPFAGGPDRCSTGSADNACPEIFAWGLRNPWKWSFDSGTGRLWLGDVGQGSWEEVDLVELGGNYGWRCREGMHDYDTSGVCPTDLIDPVIEYSHDVGRSITGGYVYRGAAIPELDGRYVFGDFSRGRIFASIDNGDGTYGYETLLGSAMLISAFAAESNGELLLINYGAGEIRRIIQSGGNASDNVATALSASGCVDVADPSMPAGGLIPYDINAPFWSDGASKERWYAVPDGTSIDVTAEGDWVFPTGSVLMKHFRIGNELVETRLMMRHTDGEWAGYSYEWNAAGTDAERLFGGKVKSVGGQDWIYPSGAECMQCHTEAAGFALGPEHGQLNRDFTYPSTGRTANQLTTADEVDLLTDPLSSDPSDLVRYPSPSDTGEPLEARARAYLHSNCSGCHRPGGPTPSDMDLRYATAFVDTNTCNVVPVSGDLGIAGAMLIVPGNASESILLNRASRRDSHGMPPLGSSLVDLDGVALLGDWIDSLAGCP